MVEKEINERIAKAKGWEQRTFENTFWVNSDPKEFILPECPPYLTDPALLWGLHEDLCNRDVPVWYHHDDMGHWIVTKGYSVSQPLPDNHRTALCLAWLSVFEKS